MFSRHRNDLRSSNTPMRNLYEPASLLELQQRLARLGPDSTRQWGTMSPAQALAHCSRSMETALGDTKLPRMFIGRIIGRAVKSMALGNDKPLQRNSPTAPAFVVREEPDLATERARLSALIDRFSTGGPQGCTTHPHTFFGPMTPDEWAILTYKHLDHHLRQFGV
jgi:hypothetical protein